MENLVYSIQNIMPDYCKDSLSYEKRLFLMESLFLSLKLYIIHFLYLYSFKLNLKEMLVLPDYDQNI